MVSMSIPVEMEDDAAAIGNWLEDLSNGDVDPRELLPAEGEDWDLAQAAGDALEPVVDRADVSHEVHTGEGSDDGIGARARFKGLGLGYNTVNQSSEESFDEAYYLSNDSGEWAWEENTQCLG